MFRKQHIIAHTADNRIYNLGSHSLVTWLPIMNLNMNAQWAITNKFLVPNLLRIPKNAEEHSSTHRKYIRSYNCAFSNIFGPHLTRRVVAFGVCIGICHRRKFGQVWGSTAPLPEVVGKLRSRKAPLWTVDYHMGKSESFCDVTPGL